MGIREDVLGEVEAAFRDADKWRTVVEELQELGFTVDLAEEVVRIVQAMRVDDVIDITSCGDAAAGEQRLIDPATGITWCLPWRIDGSDSGPVVMVSEVEPRIPVTAVTTGAAGRSGENGTSIPCEASGAVLGDWPWGEF